MELMGIFVMAMLAAALPNGVIVKPVANMYSRATEEADVVSQAIYGSNVAVIEEQGGWAKIRTADDYTGWLPAASFQRRQPYAASGKVAQVESLFAHIYREPDVTKHQPLLTVPFEARLEVVADSGRAERWLQVRLPDDRSGWVQRGDVTLAPRTLSIDEAIALAKRFLGLPYTWGGTSSSGYDCSGFTQMLCRRRGIGLPRDAGPQAGWSGSVSVTRNQLQPGDLLYFGKSPGKITHTGMYIGNGQFINATTWQRPMVKIDRLDDPHWTQLLVACKRIK